MNKLLKNEKHTGLIAVVTAGALVSGAIAYLYLTKSGQESRDKAKHALKEALKNHASEFGSKKTPFSQKTIKTLLDKIL
ncbi:hypothetical protein [Mucilaginibacter sp.]|uniref:hypothetical protein n=1 Tax=Mucilaginibacter sp. TaxID=1882438 RepID=UPI0035BBDA62